MLALPVLAEAQPSIDHAGLECIEPGRFAVVLSGIDPGPEIQTAKVYFRSSLYPDFYYVEMARETERFVGILPQVSPETPQVIYYIEAVDAVFESVRSIEFDPLVEDCDDDPAAAYFTGAEPSIIVGATTAGSSALPPGFSAIGIVGTITAAGVSSGVGGGVSAGVAVAAGAAAAGVAGAVVATNPAPGTTTTAPVAAATTTVATTTTTVPSGSTPPPATTTTTASVPGPSTTTIPGSPTTTTTATGTTTTVSGTSTSTPTTSTSSSTTTTITPITTTAPALNAGCFTVQEIGRCKVRLDATCVALPVDRYEWELDTTDQWKYVYIPNGPAAFEHTFSDCGEDNKNITFTLRVHRGASSSFASRTINVQGKDLKEIPTEGAIPLTIASLLELPSEENARARVSLDGVALTPLLADGQPVDLRSMVAPGAHSLSAIVTGGRGVPGILRFDFGATDALAPGSLRIAEGTVLVLSPTSVTFRLSGAAGERVRLDFELR